MCGCGGNEEHWTKTTVVTISELYALSEYIILHYDRSNVSCAMIYIPYAEHCDEFRELWLLWPDAVIICIIRTSTNDDVAARWVISHGDDAKMVPKHYAMPECKQRAMFNIEWENVMSMPSTPSLNWILHPSLPHSLVTPSSVASGFWINMMFTYARYYAELSLCHRKIKVDARCGKMESYD